ncbi:MAG: hypothetical protein JWM11_2588 [Planctomycetaceae bacterium]|nr:hypothetical protein [Planctomycetaceae bacterium]
MKTENKHNDGSYAFTRKIVQLWQDDQIKNESD